jgi:hypothetical protein
MSFKDYIQKLQQRPVRERERIAIVVTIIGFFIFVGIWIISFNEMNKQSEQPIDETSASLNDLKTNFETGKDSIQNMMNQLPNQTPPAGEAGGATGVDNNAAGNNLQKPIDNPSPENSLDGGVNNIPPTNSGSPDQKKDSVPQLP